MEQQIMVEANDVVEAYQGMLSAAKHETALEMARRRQVERQNAALLAELTDLRERLKPKIVEPSGAA